MEALTRLVADSLARHGFDRPVDPRRLQWSRWFRCDSPRSLLVVPSKPGIFALAEEIMDLGTSNTVVERAVLGCPERSSAEVSRRMLAVLQFSEDDDMAFTLDRMFTRINPLRERLASGRCFLRFVVIEDESQRRSICNALNQWMLSSAEKASGIGADFQSSLELTDVGTARPGRTVLSDKAASTPKAAQGIQSGRETDVAPPARNLDSGANKNLHCPHPLPSGF
jgi:hypothetical protein